MTQLAKWTAKWGFSEISTFSLARDGCSQFFCRSRYLTKITPLLCLKMFLCQLSKQNTLVPVCTKYGTIYDYHAITQYIHQYNKDPQTQLPLQDTDLTKIDISYLTQSFANNFTDDKEKLLSRLLYERDALLRVVAKVMQDYNVNEEPLVKRKKARQEYTFHDFNEEISNCKVLQSRKAKNKGIKNVELEFTSDLVDHFPNVAKHPLSSVELTVNSNKVLLMHDNAAIQEYLLHTKKQPSQLMWHCDLSIFFIIYSTFIDVYHISTGYVETWHIKHDIKSVKCCSNGYYVGILQSNSQIDIFDLRKISDDTKGFLQSIDIKAANAEFAFTKKHDLVVFGKEIR